MQEFKSSNTLNTSIAEHGKFAHDSSGSSLLDYSPNRQSEQLSESSVDESPTQKVRTLREIYESCSFSLIVLDPS